MSKCHETPQPPPPALPSLTPNVTLFPPPHRRFAGNSSVPVPSHYFAVALQCDEGATGSAQCADMRYRVQAYILPHRDNLTNCMVSTGQGAHTHTHTRTHSHTHAQHAQGQPHQLHGEHRAGCTHAHSHTHTLTHTRTTRTGTTSPTAW